MAPDPQYTVAELAAEPRPSRPRDRSVLTRFLLSPASVIALALLILLLLMAALGPALWPYTHAEITPDLSQPPSWAHPMGTDNLGRDVFAQVLRGLQQSLLIAGSTTLVGVLIGTTLGLVAGYFGATVDVLVMRLVDLTLTVPVLAIGAFLGSVVPAGKASWLLLALILAVFMWVSVARLVRGVVLGVRDLPYVYASRVMGAGPARILLRHLLPNVLDHIIVAGTLLFSAAILAESSLSFLGFGVQPPDTSLGLLVASGQSAILTRPWLFLFPGGLIILLVLVVNYVGEGIRRASDPRSGGSYLPVGRKALGRRRVPQDRVAAEPSSADVDLLTVRDLEIAFGGTTRVNRISFTLRRSEVLALVGESGSGKSLTAQALVGMVPAPGTVAGSVRLGSLELVGLGERDWATLRGRRIAMILQDPSTALNPVLSIGAQFAHSLTSLPKPAQRARMVELLEAVAIPEPERVLAQYPHQLSGGMRQRVAIAMSLVDDPDILIADEPTTALDVSVQAVVTATLLQVRERFGTSILFISHDLGVVASLADRVLVMREGDLVEAGAVRAIYEDPQHPYTQRLLNLVPRLPVLEASP